MGKRPTRPLMIRAVLDTNVVISALLFSGPPSQLVSAWQSSRLRPAMSAQILNEYVRVLAYPEFELTSIHRSSTLTACIVRPKTSSTWILVEDELTGKLGYCWRFDVSTRDPATAG
jgi:putative PIN family toxin of toxin-antitoxin system